MFTEMKGKINDSLQSYIYSVMNFSAENVYLLYFSTICTIAKSTFVKSVYSPRIWLSTSVVFYFSLLKYWQCAFIIVLIAPAPAI
jgi:hypothetical protein